MPRPTREGIYQQAGTPYWYCRFYDKSGKLCRISTGETDQQAAQQVYNRLRIQAGCKPDEAATITVNTILDIYHANHGHKLTGRGYHTGVTALLRFFDLVPWEELGKRGDGVRNIRNYKQQRLLTCKPATINREIGILSAAANVALEEGLEIRNYAEGQREAVPRTQYYWLTKEQGAALVAACADRDGFRNSPHLHDWVIIALGTGCRMSEILKLRVRDIALRHNVIRLPTSKSDEPHEIPMTESVRAAIERRLERCQQLETPYLFANDKTGKPIKTIIQQFKRACKRAGIPVSSKALDSVGMRVHDTRHTVGSWLMQDGAALEAVQDLLNHSDLRTTQQYAHHAPGARKATVARLPKL